MRSSMLIGVTAIVSLSATVVIGEQQTPARQTYSVAADISGRLFPGMGCNGTDLMMRAGTILSIEGLVIRLPDGSRLLHEQHAVSGGPVDLATGEVFDQSGLAIGNSSWGPDGTLQRVEVVQNFMFDGDFGSRIQASLKLHLTLDEEGSVVRAIGGEETARCIRAGS